MATKYRTTDGRIRNTNATPHKYLYSGLVSIDREDFDDGFRGCFSDANHVLSGDHSKTKCGLDATDLIKGHYNGRLDYCDTCFAPEVSAPRQSGGWVSPEGRFYPCRSYEHTTSAFRLGDSTGGRGLEDDGWVHIYASGEFYIDNEHRGRISQATLDTIFDIQEASQGLFWTNIKASLGDTIALMSEL